MAFDPTAWHQDNLGLSGDAVFVVQELADQKVNGGGPDLVWILVNTGKIAGVGAPLEGDKADVGRDAESGAAEPVGDARHAVDDDVGLLRAQPAVESGFVPIGGDQRADALAAG
jgi:hypothetical protein